MKPIKRTVLIPLDQQPEDATQDAHQVEAADSNPETEDLFPSNDFIPTQEEKEELSMTEEEFPTIDANLFGSTSPTLRRKTIGH